jgi:23S rRNA (uracil1939-C5)-methyltransferase
MGEVQGLGVVDAYCGMGRYGLHAAAQGARAIGIESDPSAAVLARLRAGDGFTLLEGRVEERIAEALPVDIAVLNPPRAGVGEGVMEALSEAETPRIVYVSCDPATLARDLGRAGPDYGVGRLEVFDLFPQTARVETLLVLERN